MSIRTRLAIAVALVLVVTLALTGAVLVRSTRATLVDQVDDKVYDLATRAKEEKGRPSRGDRDGRDGSVHPL